MTARARLAGAMARPRTLELYAALAAVALSALVMAHLLLSSRATLLTEDADSVLLPLLRGSILEGRGFDPASSPVLFFPEFVAHAVLTGIGLDARIALIVQGLLQLVAFYVALRLLAGAVVRQRRPAVAALGAFTVVVVLSLIESSPSRDSIEIVSLLATTTYYASTVIAVPLALSFALRALRRPRPLALLGLVTTAAIATLTNPLFVAWLAAPLLGVLVLAVVLRRVRLLPATIVTLATAIGCGVGWIARTPFSSTIVAHADDYLKPDSAVSTLKELVREVLAHSQSVAGVVALIVMGLVAAATIASLVHGLRARDAGATVVALFGIVAPIVCVAGMLYLGNGSPRYFMPLWIAPVCALLVMPIPRLRRGILLAGSSVVAVASLVIAAAAVPSTPAAIAEASDDACLTQWVDSHDEIGVGQYWTVRAAKAYSAHPSRLLQVTYTLHPYEWIVNRIDFRGVDRASYVVTGGSAGDAALLKAADAEARPESVATCGRFTITDYGAPVIVVQR